MVPLVLMEDGGKGLGRVLVLDTVVIDRRVIVDSRDDVT